MAGPGQPEAAADTPAFSIVPVAPVHRTDWARLYAAYADFYRSPQTAEMRERVWGWLFDPGHEVEGFVAVDATGRAIGLAHFRPFARPLAASTGGFLDDLFVAPDWRGRRVGEALIEAVATEGRRRGWALLRWITAEDNARARALYDRVAESTFWVTYQIPLR
jgi:GNAT superfamily N-acetyltransferase